MRKPVLCIFVSEVASLIGKNKYKHVDEAIKVVIDRNNGKKADNTDEYILDNIQDNVLKSELIRATNMINTENESVEIVKNACKLYDVNYNETEGIVRRIRGNKREIQSLDEENVVTTQQIVTKKIEGEKMYLKVFGKVDGITRNGTIIETKNRRYRLFDEIPIYEKVQLEMYMWCNADKQIIHKQKYNDVSDVIHYYSDEKLLNEIFDKLDSLCKNIEYKNRTFIYNVT